MDPTRPPLTGDFDTDTGGPVNDPLTPPRDHGAEYERRRAAAAEAGYAGFAAKADAEQATADTAGPPYTHTAVAGFSPAAGYRRAQQAASVAELLSANADLGVDLDPSELLVLRLAERSANAAEATYNLLAQLVNGLMSNPMVGAMMGGQ